MTAMSCAAAVAAYRGQDADTQKWALGAAHAAAESGFHYMRIAPLSSLAFLQTSRRQYESALQTLLPLLATFDPAHDTEIMVGGRLPDAIEALISRAATTRPNH